MSDNQLTTTSAPRASDQLASFLGIEKGMMLDTLKAQCFKGKRPDEVSDAQLAAFVSTANALQVNPLLPGMLYAYPERNGGITPILGPDGVFKKLDEFISTGKLRGYECEVKMGADGKPESATAIIHRVGENTAAKYTAYFSEWCVTSNPNWVARPRHMLWVRAIKQAARQVIHGLPMDTDEYEIAKMTNVTPDEVAPSVPDRPAPPPRQKKGASTVKQNEVIVEAQAPEVKAAPEAPPTESVQHAAPVTVEEPKPVEAAPVSTPSNRTELADKEIITISAKVTRFICKDIKLNGESKPSVQAEVSSPEYVGVVYHHGGATAAGEGEARKLTELPAWQLESPVTLKLRGQFSNGAKKVLALVEEAVAVSQQPAPDEF